MNIVERHIEALPILIAFVLRAKSSNDEDTRKDAYRTIHEWDRARATKHTSPDQAEQK